VVPVLLPLELPEPMLPELLPDEPDELPLLGAVVLLGEVVELLPLVPPLDAPELDLLKCASHSAREIWPSLLVSTDEKLGAELLELLLPPDRLPPELELPPEAALPDEPDEPDDMPDEPDEPEEPPLEADGVEEELPLAEVPPDVPEDELCATATLESANSAAAVAALKSFNFIVRSPCKVGETASPAMQDPCPAAFSRRKLRSPPRSGATAPSGSDSRSPKSPQAQARNRETRSAHSPRAR